MDYTKLSDQKLLKILMCNPPDVPHCQKAQGALQMRNQRNESGIQVWLLIFRGGCIASEALASPIKIDISAIPKFRVPAS